MIEPFHGSVARNSSTSFRASGLDEPLSHLPHPAWPDLIYRHPDLRLKIVGKGADRRLIDAVNSARNIELTGFIQDLEPVYRESRIAIAPLFFGSGMKVKVLSSLARGIPTVTTPVGVEGIAARHGEHVMVAEDASDMVSQIEELLCSQEACARLSEQSRKLIEQRYTWGAMFESMRLQINLALAGSFAAESAAQSDVEKALVGVASPRKVA